MRRLQALFLAAFAASMLALTPTALAAKGMQVGLQDDDVFLPRFGPIYPFATAMAQTKQLNVTYIRTQVVWSDAMTKAQQTLKKPPKKVTYDWSLWDGLARQARASGIHLQMVLTGPAPAWATGNHKIGVYKPNAKLYAQFVSAAMKHFRGKVTRYSLWNEPNWIGWLAPVKDQAKLYRGLYTAGYAAARKANPTAQILLGETSAYREPGLSTAPLALMRGVLCLDKKYKPIKKMHCKPLAANGYAQHPYDLLAHKPTFKFPGADNVTMGTLSRLTTALDKAQKSGALKVLGAKRMPVYLTEYGYRTKPSKHPVSDALRSKYLVQAFQIAQRNPRVKELVQYQLVRPAPGPHFFWQSNLLGPKGQKSKTWYSLLKWTTSAAKKGLIAKPKKF